MGSSRPWRSRPWTSSTSPAATFAADLAYVDDLEATLAELGVEADLRGEFPLGPFATLRTPGGQRLGFYEATRPAMLEGFAGRMDFT